MECPICGHPLGENDAFCENCGNFSLPLQNNDRPLPMADTPPGTPSEGTAKVPVPEDAENQSPVNPARKVAERLYPPPDVDLEERAPISADPIPLVETEPSPTVRSILNKRSEPRPAPGRPGPRQEKRSGKGWKVVTTVACCLMILSIIVAAYIVINTAGMRVQLNKAQKESSTAQANAQELEEQVASLTESLATAESDRESLGTQVAELQAQIDGMEGSVNQSEYDKESAQRQLDDATTQLEEATGQLEAVQGENAGLQTALEESQAALTAAETENETLAAENESLTEQMEAYKEEAEFIDEYVVFVMLSSSDKYYHKYSCPSFTKRNFVAYSIRLAEANGYSACPICSGGAEITDDLEGDGTDEDEDADTGVFGGLFGFLP